MKMMILIVVALLVVCLRADAAVKLYVSTRGSDTDSGTESKPFASLERARDAIRALKQSGGLPEGGVRVSVRGGVYPVLASFTLGAEDSGTVAAPVVYRAAEGEEVRLVGGKEVGGFKPVRDSGILARLDPSARGKVVQTDLKAQGITDYGKITPRGFGRAIQPAGLELFFKDKPMPLAEWPNNGWTNIAAVPAGPDAGKFNYDGDRPSRWAKSDDIWIHGYWTWPWADSYEHVKSIDTQTKEIATDAPHGVYGYQAGKRFRFLNVLEELDSPGEWYLDRKTGILYFWPPERIGKDLPIVSIIEQPMIALKGTSHVTIRGFVIEGCRGNAVSVEGGTANLVADCTVCNVGNVAVIVSGGTKNGVTGCEIRDAGDGGVSLSGGDRMTLTPAGNFVENCNIHDFSRWDRTYRPGIVMTGVGDRIAHNHIHHAPHAGIIAGGNDHIVEFNDVHDICLETGDAGAFYMGRDWTQRGNEVRYNYFHNLGGLKGDSGKSQFTDTMGVYLDDWTSGTRVYGNVFYKANRAILVGGGRDNVILNNIFVDCETSIHIDGRGVAEWTSSYWDGTDNTMFDRLKAVNGTQPPYSVRYPQLANILNDEPRIPKGNVVRRNISVGGRWMIVQDKFDRGVLDIGGNLADTEPGFSDPLFVDRANRDFRLKPDSPAFAIGFKQIPIDRIGTYR